MTTLNELASEAKRIAESSTDDKRWELIVHEVLQAVQLTLRRGDLLIFWKREPGDDILEGELVLLGGCSID